RGKNLGPAHVRHSDVGEHDVWAHLEDLLEPFLSPLRETRGEPLVAQQNIQRVENSRLVVDDEDTRLETRRIDHEKLLAVVATAPPRAGVGEAGCGGGSTTVKRVPFFPPPPAPESTSTTPRCASIARCTTAR